MEKVGAPLAMKQRNNTLLVKDDVGRAKPCVMKLPPSNFAYGKPDRQDHEGVGVITSSWQAHNKSHPPAHNEIDFRKMNKFTSSRGVS